MEKTGEKTGAVAAYKAALDTIIFTDYLDFHLYRHGQLAETARIGDMDGD